MCGFLVGMGARSSKRLRRRHEIVIVGANFAGLSAALDLPSDCDVAVIDPEPWFEWLPNIHELVSGVKKPSDLRLPRREILASAGHRFVQGRFVGIDSKRKALRLDDGTTIQYEHCVLALGGVGNDFGVPGAARFGMHFNNVAECDAIGKRLKRLAARKGPLSVIVVGGGFEGIEALGEVLRRYRGRDGLQIHLVEVGGRLMPEGPPAVDEMIRRRLIGMPVRLHCGKRVIRVTATGVTLDDGERISGDITIWTGGAKAPDVVADAGFDASRAGWIQVRKDLSCRGFPGVFAAGDVADVPRPIAKQAYHAIDMGRHAARNILRRRAGRKTLPFSPAPKPMLVAFGDLDTFLMTESKVVAGPGLAAAKEAVFQATIAGFDRLASVGGLQRAKERGVRAISELVFPKLRSWEETVRLLSVNVEDV